MSGLAYTQYRGWRGKCNPNRTNIPSFIVDQVIINDWKAIVVYTIRVKNIGNAPIVDMLCSAAKQLAKDYTTLLKITVFTNMFIE